MPIGKDSIQKRVAKVTPEEKTETVIEKVTPPTEEKAPVEKKPAPKKTTTTAKKATTSTQKKSTTSTAKKTTSASKPAAKKPVVKSTSVLANVSPETVEKVTGHKEGSAPECIAIGQKLPTHLL